MKLIEIRKTDHIVRIDMLGSGVHATQKLQQAGELSEIFDLLIYDADVRAVILCEKEGGSFCINEVTLVEISQLMRGGELPSIADSISMIEVPVIAGIEGDALGLGLEWILACDIRIASETSRFGLPYAKVGLIPSEGGTQRLARLVGRGWASEMMFTGEWIDAQEALRIGLVNRTVPLGEVSKSVMELGIDMASKSPISTRYTKEAICKGMDLNLDQGLRLEADLYFLMHTTRDRREGLQAFQEKRKANFEGK